jgi:hypothetical protein
MRNDSRPNPHHTAAVPSLGVADRRSVPDRRVCSDRRLNADRRRSQPTAKPCSAELEKRVAAAIRQQGDRNIEGNGSGWDKLIIPFA